jgi:predicted ribosomally synthesized peptide with SipW-like signal peptide
VFSVGYLHVLHCDTIVGTCDGKTRVAGNTQRESPERVYWFCLKISLYTNYRTMKKIIMSLGMIVFVGALVAGGTGAFFSDTETSTGNVFTAGAIDLKVDSQQHYNNMVCTEVTPGIYQWKPEVGFTPLAGHYPVPNSTCNGTWALTDLGITHKFFDFADVKPGDEGENTISLHIDSNPAWACADVAITSNDDNTCVDPEVTAEGVGICGNSSPTATTDGDLAQNLWFTAWNDNATTSGGVPGDNIHQAGEVLFFAPGPASNVLAGGTLTLADGGTLTPLPGGTTSYIGLAWCAGTMTASTAVGPIGCNGATMGNNAQTDSMTANITFRVEQARNNAAFRCTPQT